MKTREDLIIFLDNLGIKTKTTEHEALFTVEESKAYKMSIAGAHSKNLFVKDKKGRIFALITLADAVIDLKKIHELIGASGRVSFTTADQLYLYFGVKPGSVTPFGAINDSDHIVTIILDAALMAHDLLNFHPLENTATTSIARADFLRFFKATGHKPEIIAISGLGGEDPAPSPISDPH